MNSKIYHLILSLLFFATVQLAAQGGMWIPSEIKGSIEKNMKSLGMKMDAEDIYSEAHSSLKDAIVRFGRGCTGEIISAKGLLLTNHHCGYGSIQRLSTVDNNLLKNGYWAASYEDELPVKGLTVTFVERIKDVTPQILKGTAGITDPAQLQSAIDKNIDSLKKSTAIEPYQKVEIKPFYYGNKYYLFVYNIYRDVRFVAAPPESIGKFGADTDNWMWPRHNADFSIFRVYAGKDNLPAAYSEDNVPYKPKHFLPVSTAGIKQNDFTLVFGFPGRTQEYLPAVAVDQIANKLDPVRISIRKAALDVMEKYMRQDEKIRLQYASKYAGIANYWKKWIGEMQGINKVKAVEKKKEFEREFMRRVMSRESTAAMYGDILKKFDSLYNKFEKYNIAENRIYESFFRSMDFMRIAGYLNRLEKYYKNSGAAGYNEFKSRLLPYLKGIYKNMDATIDKEIFIALAGKYKAEAREEFIPPDLKRLDSADALRRFADTIYNSPFLDYQYLVSVVDTGDIDYAIRQMQKDRAYRFAAEINKISDEKVSIPYNDLNTKIYAVQKKYMKALLEVFPEKNFFPDANGTLRVTYGQVKGYHPRDAVYYEPVTHIEGVIEKYKPGDYEFDLPPKFLQLYKNRDFGKYTDAKGSVPVCFIGTNHTTGGNSGSPAIDAYGNLTGLNFDRVWEGTMSDLYYDPSICRNIMVDIRYILFIIDKYGNASRILDELKLVNPGK